MTTDIVLKSLLKKTPESLQKLLVVMHVMDQHGTKIIGNNEVFGISDLGRELAVMLLQEKKWQNVAKRALRDISEQEILH